MDCSELKAFEKYPQLLKMNPLQTDEYLNKLHALLIDASRMPLLQQALTLHDFFMANAAMICLQRADDWHLQMWKHKQDNDGPQARMCEQLRDEAVACKEAIRANLVGGAS